MNSLQVLAQKRDDLLLAELAALLHDVGKCTSEFAYYPQARSVRINNQDLDPYKAVFSASELSRYQFSQQRIQKQLDEANQQYALHKLLDDRVRTTLDSKFTVENISYSFREAIYFSRPKFATRISAPLGRKGEPLDLLANCHGEGHVEKENPLPSITPQPVARYSAFGYLLDNLAEPDQPESLTKRLNNLNWQAILQHNIEELRALFLEALGDTRFPINEITLWDWSYAVASLYKSELARHYLNEEWHTRDHLLWRALRVNFDVLALYAKAVKIGDLLGYQRVVDEACEAVKKLVEEEYPLGNEIYRDSTGIYFTFPDLDLPADLAQEIRRRVEKVEAEVAPRIAVTVGDGANAAEQLKGILGKARKEALEALAQPFDSQNLSAHWQQQWETVGDGKWELCPVCRLRPMREGAEACETCKQRRGSRIAAWKENPSQTIWMDEIADHNGRIALILGKFGLDDWLSGDLVQTMLVKAVENTPDQCVPKNPSPARLRRVWETCQRFWTETVEQAILAKHVYGTGTQQDADLRRVRWLLIPDKKTGWQEDIPYDGTVNGKPISLLWRAQNREFITVINLQLTGKFRAGQVVTVSDPGNPRRTMTFTAQSVAPATDRLGEYMPYLPLLASPDQFLALIPAADALEIADKIRTEYQKQFSKVQNRLPLFLGLVFFPRKMPLMAVMDTARRMVEQVEFKGESWQVAKSDNGKLELIPQSVIASEAKQSSSGEEIASVQTSHLAMTESRITWTVLTKMGDNTTDDVWYPYFFVADSVDVSDRERRFRHDVRWLVHVNNLRKGDRVHVTPSRFAYIYLQHTARRFGFDPQKDSLLLDELPRLMNMWAQICQTPKMTNTKLRGVQALLEDKWQAWRLDEESSKTDGRRETFKQLAKTTFDHAGLPIDPDDVLNGCFRNCLELYTKILKLRLKEAQSERQLETTNA
jgi:hypothetical protein